MYCIKRSPVSHQYGCKSEGFQLQRPLLLCKCSQCYQILNQCIVDSFALVLGSPPATELCDITSVHPGRSHVYVVRFCQCYSSTLPTPEAKFFPSIITCMNHAENIESLNCMGRASVYSWTLLSGRERSQPCHLTTIPVLGFGHSE